MSWNDRIPGALSATVAILAYFKIKPKNPMSKKGKFLLVVGFAVLAVCLLWPTNETKNADSHNSSTSGSNSPAVNITGNVGNFTIGHPAATVITPIAPPASPIPAQTSIYAPDNKGTIIGTNNAPITFNITNTGSDASTLLQCTYEKINEPQTSRGQVTYLTSGTVTLVSTRPVGILHLEATGGGITGLHTSGDGLTMAHAGNNGTVFYNDIQNAYGKYQFSIDSSKPGTFKLTYYVK